MLSTTMMTKLAMVGGLAALSGMMSAPTVLAAPHNSNSMQQQRSPTSHSALIKRLSSNSQDPLPFDQIHSSSEAIDRRQPEYVKKRRGRTMGPTAEEVYKRDAERLGAGDRSAVSKRASNAISKKRSKQLRRRSDGTVCVIRGSNATTTLAESASTSASTSASASASVTVSSTSAITSTSTEPIASAVASIVSSVASVAQSVVASVVSSAAAAATSAVAAASSGGSTAPAKGNGLGLAWPNGGYTGPDEPGYVGNYVGSKVGWYYTWGAYNVSLADEVGLAFIPMLWGADSTHTDAWQAAQSQWPTDTMEKYAFFLNEPEQGSQSNIAAADAVSTWLTYMSPLAAAGWKIGAAATSNSATGLEWVLEFEKLCPQCKSETSFYPVHWYDTTAETMEEYLEAYYTATGSDKHLWVTEYACQSFNTNPQCTTSGTTDYHQTVTPWFASTSYVERWSPFGVMKDMQGVNEANALMDSNGAITDLGTWYINQS